MHKESTVVGEKIPTDAAHALDGAAAVIDDAAQEVDAASSNGGDPLDAAASSMRSVKGRWDLLVVFPEDDDAERALLELKQEGSQVIGSFCNDIWVCDGPELEGTFNDPTLQLSSSGEISVTLDATLDDAGTSFSGTVTSSKATESGTVVGCNLNMGCEFTSCGGHCLKCTCF